MVWNCSLNASWNNGTWSCNVCPLTPVRRPCTHERQSEVNLQISITRRQFEPYLVRFCCSPSASWFEACSEMLFCSPAPTILAVFMRRSCLISKVFTATEQTLDGCFLFFTPFPINARSADSELLRPSDYAEVQVNEMTFLFPILMSNNEWTNKYKCVQ